MMTKRFLLLIFIIAPMFVCQAQSYSGSNDTIDALHYDIRLDMGHIQLLHIQGSCTVTLKLLQPASYINLGLEHATIDSVQVDGTTLSAEAFTYNQHWLRISTQGASVGDTLNVAVYYGSNGWHDAIGDGGFWCNTDAFYNLGEDRYVRPFSMGRSWFPCNDSVYDKATYTFQFTTAPGWRAICSGNLDSTTTHSDLSTTFYYTLSHPVSTYHVGINAAQYTMYQRNFTGIYGTYPAHMAYLNLDSANVARNFLVLDTVLPFFEQKFGPYRWNNIGYSAVPVWGGMEHVNNIAISNNWFGSEYGKSVIVHEFAHQWFGNVVTCARIQDLWFNEGGATFAEQEAMSALSPDIAASAYSERQDAEYSMIVDRDGFRPLCGMPDRYSFQSETYYKGAMVVRELRHLLGDGPFYSSLQTLFAHNTFTAMDSYQIRDSLSLYSGVNLTPFFDFHIFGTGFAEYHIDSMQTTNGVTDVWLSQHLWGASQPCLQAKVPVSFFSSTGDYVTRDVEMSGTTGHQQFSLPFSPSYAVVDYIDEIADAATNQMMTFTDKTTSYALHSNFSMQVIKIEEPVNIMVSEHWAYPEETPVPGVVRWANHRWIINGEIPSTFKGVGIFAYRCQPMESDSGFCETIASKDSLRLFYRANAGQPWTLINASRGYDNIMGNCFKRQNVKAGEYILAIVDTAQLGIPSVDNPKPASFSLAPNPACNEVTVTLHNPEPSTLTLFNAAGRELLHRKLSSTSTTINLRSYPRGVYFVSITTPSSTSTRKLIVN